MSKSIIYKNLNNGPVEVCRDLSNELYRYQAEKGKVFKEVLASMSFDNRLKQSFEESKERFLLVAYDGETPVGYVFAATESATEEIKAYRPSWAGALPENSEGLYPNWLKTPVKIGELNNLYVKSDYRGLGIGQELTERAIEWLRGIADVKYLFTHVSNGNNAGTLYEKFGFKHSHSVFGNFIEAYYQENIREK